MKKWNMPTRQSPAADEMIKLYGIIPGSILCSRGIADLNTAEKLFRADDFSDDLNLADLEKAKSVIENALENGHKITIYGDYDCDGVTSTAILYSYLDSLGAEVDYYIPTRAEGYGMNVAALKRIVDGGTQLVITVDNGTSAYQEGKFLKENGVSLVITDHHRVGDAIIPDCAAFVNPNRQDDTSHFKNLCGAGVVLKLICALEGSDETVIDEYADLAMIGTIGDVVPLLDENRFIVRRGIEQLKKSGNVGLSRLASSVGLTAEKLTATNIAYKICPIINSAGRIDTADIAVKLLLAEDEEEAARICESLLRMNDERRDFEQKIHGDISQMIEKDPTILAERVLVLAGSGWHEGVIGIVSANIAEKFGKPTVIISVNGGECKGSCRSVGDFSIFDMLSDVQRFFTKFGGHPGAGGFSMNSAALKEFTRAVQDYAAEKYPTMPAGEADADMAVTCDMLTVENVEELNILEPFGEGFKKPVFLLQNVEVVSKRPLKDGKYISFEVKSGGSVIKVLSFRVSYNGFASEKGDRIDIIANAEINEYRDSKSVVLRLLDYRPTGFREDRFLAAAAACDGVIRGETFDKKLTARIFPQTREDLIKIYNLIKKNDGRLSLEQLAIFDGSVNYCMLKITALAFCEAGMAETDGEYVRIVPVSGKKDLFQSGLLAELPKNCR